MVNGHLMYKYLDHLEQHQTAVDILIYGDVHFVVVILELIKGVTARQKKIHPPIT